MVCLESSFVCEFKTINKPKKVVDENVAIILYVQCNNKIQPVHLFDDDDDDDAYNMNINYGKINHYKYK